MGMIDEQLNGCAVTRFGLERLRVLAQVLIELDELERLVLDVGEEVVVADEGEDMRVAQLEEVRKGFAGLSVQDVAAEASVSLVNVERNQQHAQLGQRLHQHMRLGRPRPVELVLDGEDDGRDVVDLVRPGVYRSQEGLEKTAIRNVGAQA